ncbi:flavin-containing monooxygenase 5-like [Tubulanus polymorphus]|uniref:flavin-containing monooxygenase 5-like n=1 Tax=Tubulanus polymorphus TaxID=672921 RepID=UPI003DA69531
MSSKKLVCIVGAGASGLPAIKSCLENGLEPECFERTDDIGGLWNFREQQTEDVGCVMRSTVINTSKEIMSYSDFPIPPEYPNFMPHRYVLQYFRLYANHFGLGKYIKFNMDVKFIDKCEDFATTGKWKVTILDRKTGKETLRIFDAVMLCTGHHAKPYWGKFPGEDKFRGQRLHSHSYRGSLTEFENKKVVIIGIGNSALDAAVDISRVSKQVYLSTRRGAWIFNRIHDNGIPIDISALRRVVETIKSHLPASVIDWLFEREVNRRFDHEMYRLKPSHRPTEQHPSVNDDVANRIICGAVQIRPNVEEFTETGVKFDDGSRVDDIDAVIYATGYAFGFPYLTKSVLDVKENKVDLFMNTFPPDLEQSTLAVIGCFQPLGSVMPGSELQCRWATHVFKGEKKLPSKTEMWNDVNQYHESMSKKYVKSPRHTIQVDWIPFLDGLAEQIGCKPDIRGMLFSDPKFAMKLYFGPCTPYQYRLQGPHSWPPARRTIETVWDRVLYPLKTRPIPKSDKPSKSYVKILLLYIIPLMLIIYVLRILFKI